MDYNKQIVNFTDYVHGMKPYKCPICNGTGIVSDDFYFAVNGYCSPTKICGHCQGSGIIWDMEDEDLVSNNIFGER